MLTPKCCWRCIKESRFIVILCESSTVWTRSACLADYSIGFVLENRMFSSSGKGKAIARQLACLCLLAGCISVGWAGECTKTVRSSEDPPYDIRGSDGSFHGATIDLVREALKRMQCQAHFIEMPWARGLRNLRNGSLDILPGALVTKEREAFAYFSIPLHRSPNVLFVSQAAAEKFSFTDLAELSGTTFRLGAQIDVVYSTQYQALLQQPAFTQRLTLLNSREGAWKMLAAGRLDGLIADEVTGLLELEKLGLSKAIVRSDLVVSAEAATVAFSKKSIDEAFVVRFNQALQEMFADGTYERIEETYLPCQVSVEWLGCVPG